jgi:hypothetical protein
MYRLLLTKERGGGLAQRFSEQAPLVIDYSGRL